MLREKNEDIIDTADTEIEISQDAVHQTLNGGTRKFKAEARVVKSVGTQRCDDCHLWNVHRVNRDLVLPLQEMQLHEALSDTEFGGHASHVGQRVVVRFNEHIKITVITTELPGAIIFLD